MSAFQLLELQRLSDQWRQHASHLDLQFLGEIALDTEFLETLLISLGKFHRRVDEPQLSFALAVGAVNWAYWRGVEDLQSRGFIESFMTHSIGHSDGREWQDSWGPAIESAICDWSKQPPRSGTYRYVGLILRHAGVPHNKIPRLAQLLQYIDDNVGWPNVPTSRDTTLQAYVESFFGTGCIGEHLCSDAGLSYLRSLCADLQLLRSHAMRSSTDLPGYRPGLIAEILKNLRLGPQTAAPQPFQAPFVEFDDASGNLKLVFDERLVRRKPQIQCDQWDRKLFDSRLDIGPGGITPEANFTGRFPDGRIWKTRGWAYEDSLAWAMFRTDRRLFSTHSHSDPIAMGEYILVTADLSDLSLRWPLASDDGERVLPNGTPCRVWRVTLQPGDDGKLNNLRVTKTTQPWIECVNANPITRYTRLDAVCDSPPRIRIHDLTAHAYRRHRLVLSRQGQQAEIVVPTSSDSFAEIVLSDLAIGELAEVSLVPVGFQRVPKSAEIVRLVRFPGYIDVVNGLWPTHEEVELRVNLSDNLAIQPQKDLMIDHTASAWRVRVPARVHSVSLILNHLEATLNIDLPVSRCSLTCTNSPESPAIFDRRLLRQMCESHDSLTISGIAGKEIDLIARDNSGLDREWRRGLRLGPNGRLDVSATELVDVVRNENGIKRIFMRCNGFQVSTGGVFVEPTELDLSSGPWDPPIEAYLQLLRAPLPHPEPLDTVALPVCLAEYARLICVVDHTLSLSPILVPRESLSPQTSKWVSQIETLLSTQPRASGVEASTWKTETTAWLKSAPLSLHPQRWDAWLAALIAEIDRRIDIAAPTLRLLEGKSDSSVPEGIAHGWQYYLRAQGNSSAGETVLIDANSYFSTASRGPLPWSAVAERLSALTMLRAGAVSHFMKAVRGFTPTADCPTLNAALSEIYAILAMEGILHPAKSPDEVVLSARSDDQKLAVALAGQLPDWIAAAQECWLSAWLGWHWSVIMNMPPQDRDQARKLLARLADTVPQRARRIVADELEAEVPRSIATQMESR